MEAKDKEFSLQAALAKGRPLPDWALNEPPLYPGDGFFLTAFYVLSSCRALPDSGPGPIPWDKIVEYGDRSGLDLEMSEAFVYIIRELDAAYLKWFTKKVPSPKPPKAGKYDRIQYRR